LIANLNHHLRHTVEINAAVGCGFGAGRGLRAVGRRLAAVGGSGRGPVGGRLGFGVLPFGLGLDHFKAPLGHVLVNGPVKMLDEDHRAGGTDTVIQRF